jgi:predicted alpha/beta-hydrolase family hydrolase
MPPPQQLRFPVPRVRALLGARQEQEEVSALLSAPKNPRWLLVVAHGAGAGMTHPFLQNLSDELNAVGIATFRYQFPYMEQHRGAPDKPPVLIATVAAAVQAAKKAASGLPLLAGGKSMGGRMTSQAAAQLFSGKTPDAASVASLSEVRGLVFFGFPLHPPGSPGTKRADHLANVRQPMLFLQGTRDTFADLKLLRPICANLGSRATLHIIDSADHSFHVLKSSGTTDPAVLHQLAQTTASWAENLPKS